MVEAGSETAVRWMPVSDFPRVHCQVWRVRTDDDFVVTVEGDFYVGEETRTLVIEFSGVFALSAHEDLTGISMMSNTTAIPVIGEAPKAQYAWPAMKIEHSRWLASISRKAPTQECTHFALLSLTFMVELIAERAEASWRE